MRYQAGFDPKVREVAILAVAREMDSQFEWAAHEPEALQVGVPADVVDIIKHRKSTQGIDETYAAIIELGREAVGKHKVASDAFARVKALFEPTKLVQLVMLMGAYASTAMLLTTFDMQVPEGKPKLAGGVTSLRRPREGGDTNPLPVQETVTTGAIDSRFRGN